MRTGFFILLFFIPVFLFAIDYSKKENWVICEKDRKETSYDLFYIYPTLVSSKKHPYMDWKHAGTAAKTLRFASAQTKEIFGKKARIFAPYVRQLEYGRAIRELKKQNSSASPFEPGLMKGMLDTKKAFLYYLQNYNNGRPFIFLGHSQGAMDLLYLLHSTEQITKEKGFVGAYLPGICVSETLFSQLFRSRKIRPAKGEKDIACVIIWNSMNQEGSNPLFSRKGALCINPLNWKTDETVAEASENLCAVFYDYRTGKIQRKPHFSGAVIDLEKGALILPLPSKSVYDAKGFMGKGVFHMNDLWFFAENIRVNAEKRVAQWKKEMKFFPEKAE